MGKHFWQDPFLHKKKRPQQNARPSKFQKKVGTADIIGSSTRILF